MSGKYALVIGNTEYIDPGLVQITAPGKDTEEFANVFRDKNMPQRLMEQIMEYNILDFSEWRDDSKFDIMFRKLIDGLELFYKA